MRSRPDARRGVRRATDTDLFTLVRRTMKARFCDTTRLKDSDTAERLGITPAELAVLQFRMNSRGLMHCTTAVTRTKYKFEPRTIADY